MHHCADKYGIARHIRLGTRIAQARFDAASDRILLGVAAAAAVPAAWFALRRGDSDDFMAASHSLYALYVNTQGVSGGQAVQLAPLCDFLDLDGGERLDVHLRMALLEPADEGAHGPGAHDVQAVGGLVQQHVARAVHQRPGQGLGVVGARVPGRRGLACFWHLDPSVPPVVHRPGETHSITALVEPLVFHAVIAPREATIANVAVENGQQVSPQQLLLRFA